MKTTCSAMRTTVTKVPLNRVVPRIVDKWSTHLLTRARAGDAEAMVSVAELQFHPSGWGAISYNPTEGERWAEAAAQAGNNQGQVALKEIRLRRELITQKTEQLRRKIVQDYFSEHTLTKEDEVGPGVWMRAHRRKLAKLRAEGFRPHHLKWKRTVAESLKERDEIMAQFYVEKGDGEDDVCIADDPGRSMGISIDKNHQRIPINMNVPASLDGLHRAMKAALDGKLQHLPYDAVPRPLLEVMSASDTAVRQNAAPLPGYGYNLVVSGETREPGDAGFARRSAARLEQYYADLEAANGSSNASGVGAISIPAPKPQEKAVSLETIVARFPKLVDAFGARQLVGRSRKELAALEKELLTNPDAIARADAPPKAGIEEEEEQDKHAELTNSRRAAALFTDELRENLAKIPTITNGVRAIQSQRARAGRDGARKNQRDVTESDLEKSLVGSELLPAEQRLAYRAFIDRFNVSNRIGLDQDNETENDTSGFESSLALYDIMQPGDLIDGGRRPLWPYNNTAVSAAGTKPARYTNGDPFLEQASREFGKAVLTLDDDPSGEEAEEEDANKEHASVSSLSEALAESANRAVGPAAARADARGTAGNASRAQWRARVAAAAQPAAPAPAAE